MLFISDNEGISAVLVANSARTCDLNSEYNIGSHYSLACDDVTTHALDSGAHPARVPITCCYV